MELVSINDRISRIIASREPLSSDVIIVKGNERTYIYDVGRAKENLAYFNTYDGEMQVILSHFHQDHVWWLTKHKVTDSNMIPGDDLSLNYDRPPFTKIYGGDHTAKYVDELTVVKEPLVIMDGVKIEIMPIPSSHAKGSLMMVVDDEYAFVGDACYETTKNGITGFNAQLLKAQIEVLKKIKARTICLSHDRAFFRPTKLMIRFLEAVYEKRKPGETFIAVNN